MNFVSNVSLGEIILCIFSLFIFAWLLIKAFSSHSSNDVSKPKKEKKSGTQDSPVNVNVNVGTQSTDNKEA